MPSRNEAARLAAAINLLRPEWPVASLQTLIGGKHFARSFHDLAVALAYVATDPATKTPARIDIAGPWWPVGAVLVPEHPHPCPACMRIHPADEPHPRRDAARNSRGVAAARAALTSPQ